MTKDILGFLSSKKTSTPTTAPKTTEAQQKPVKAPKPKVKPEKAPKSKKVKVQVQQQPQLPQYQLSDFRMQTTANNISIRITTLYLNTPIHHFILPVTQYVFWQNSPPQIKYNYVRFHTVASAFFNDLRLVDTIIQATITVIDNLFLRSRQAQQQAQRGREGVNRD